MNRCTYQEGTTIINDYIKKIDRAMYEIQKNHKDMDIENNTVDESIKDVVDKMVKECKNLKAILRDTHLR